MTNTLPPIPDVLIRPARAEEFEDFWELTCLIDLKASPDELARARDVLGQSLKAETETSFSQVGNQYLVAQNSDGALIAAAHCGPPLWIFRNQAIPTFMESSLVRRVVGVDTLAVHPDHRERGIGRAMLGHIEEGYRRAGRMGLTLRHDRAQEGFFRRRGYTSSARLALVLPPVGLVTQKDHGWRHAVKPLTDQVSFTSVRGVTAVTGLLAR